IAIGTMTLMRFTANTPVALWPVAIAQIVIVYKALPSSALRKCDSGEVRGVFLMPQGLRRQVADFKKA
ncbi:MAG: hypothetical protein ACOVNS_10290, partial [Erythrobacter sp.]